MKLKEFADKYKLRADCAVALEITESNLNMLISRGREIEQLKSGKWILRSDKQKVFNITVD